MKSESPVGENWKDVRKEIFTPKEIKKSDVRVALIGKHSAQEKKGKLHKDSNK